MSNNKKIVNISVRDKRAVGDGTVFVCDNSDYVLRFDFDNEWDGKPAKTARIIFGSKYIDLPFVGNEVEIERTPVSNRYSIGVYANDIKTSTPAIFECDYSILSSNPIHEPPSEDVYNKIMDMIEGMKVDFGSVPIMPAIDEDLKEEIPEDRVYNADLHNNLKNRDRVYVEKPEKDGGGESPLFYLSSNADKYFNPVGYKSLEAMCNALSWSLSSVVEGQHYISITADGNKSYHPRLLSIVTRTPDGGIRIEGTPKDSTDAVPYGHFKKYSFESSLIKPYEVALKGSTGALYSTPTDINTKKGSFAIRDGAGGLRGETLDKMPDGSAIDSKTLVNIGYFNTKIKSVEAIAKGRATGYVFDTVADLNTWLANSDNKAKLVVGDNFYIRAKDVPDYWWDGTQKQELETQKVDLSDYATKTEMGPIFETFGEFIQTKAEIVDVPELPTPTSVEELLTHQNKLYRTNKAEGTLIMMNVSQAGKIDGEAPATVFVVPTLPEVGNASTEEHIYIYFCVSDGTFYYGTGGGDWGTYFFDLPIVQSRDDVAQLMDCVAFLPESTTSDMYALNPLASFDGNPFIKLTEKGGNTAGSTVGEWIEPDEYGVIRLTEGGVYEYFAMAYNDAYGGFNCSGTFVYPKEIFAEAGIFGEHHVKMDTSVGSNYDAGEIFMQYSRDNWSIEHYAIGVTINQLYMKARKIRDI